MNIAMNLLNEKISYDEKISKSEDKAIYVDQDWQAEETSYYFDDGSWIVDNNGELTCHDNN
ncbi:MAG: hypothetical protein GY829_05845 [Gammaproteobacteria bacterium]|nr:hypothetical protein [Gammaproteobacteria bacterium]